MVDGTAPLFVQWRGKRVFCNPPYGPGLRSFLERALEADIAVFLIPARTDTRWFHEIVLPYAKEIRFIKGRLKFGDSKNSAPFPSMIVIFQGA
jgi:site-specific DNA-methyltransferase (adenine-specific)